jgi:hypothetical protein
MLLSRAGTQAYGMLQQSMVCFPSLSVLQEIKGNVPNSDVGTIKAQLDTARLTFRSLTYNAWNYRGSLSMDAMYITGELAWDVSGKRIQGLSDRVTSLDVIGRQFEIAIKARLAALVPDADADAHTAYVFLFLSCVFGSFSATECASVKSL